MRKLLALAFLLVLSVPAAAQNTQCSNRSPNDGSNACANTRYVDASAAATQASTYSGFSGAFTCTATGVCTLNSGVASANVGALGGDLNGNLPNPLLNTVNANPGSYGSATSIPTFTVDGKGRLTAAGTAAAAYPGQTPTQNICWVDGRQFSTIAAALAVCSSRSDIYVSINQTVSSGPSISGDGVRIHCVGAPTITQAANTAWNISGKYFNIDGCNFVGPGKTVTSSGQLFIMSGDNVSIHDNRFTAFGVVGASYGQTGMLIWTNGNRGQLYNNHFTGNGDISFSIQPFQAGTLSDFSIHDNQLQNALLFGNTTAVVSDVRFANNQLVAGDAGGGQSLCLFIAFTSNSVFSNNVCKMNANLNAGLGGTYSFASNTRLTSTGNYLYRNGGDYTDYSYEYNQCINCTITQNYAESITGGGMICEDCYNTVFVANEQNGWKNNSVGINFYDNNQSYSTQNNLNIGRNVAVFLPAATAGTGIQLTTAGSGRPTTNVLESDNVVVGPTAAGSTVGISIIGTTGAQVTGVGMGPDYIRGVATGHFATGPMASLCRLPGAVFATTAFTNSTASPAATNTCN